MSKKIASLYDFADYCKAIGDCKSCPFYNTLTECEAFTNVDELNDFILTYKKMKQKEKE